MTEQEQLDWHTAARNKVRDFRLACDAAMESCGHINADASGRQAIKERLTAMSAALNGLPPDQPPGELAKPYKLAVKRSRRLIRELHQMVETGQAPLLPRAGREAKEAWRLVAWANRQPEATP